MAAPSKYNYVLCQEICERVCNGESIKTVLNSDKKRFPSFQTFCNWKRDNQELLDLYTRSRQDKAEIVDSQIDEILDQLRKGSIDPINARIIIDTLKWKAGKYYPKMFGDKMDITTDGEKLSSFEYLVHKPKD